MTIRTLGIDIANNTFQFHGTENGGNSGSLLSKSGQDRIQMSELGL
jgi:hypothetical protein